MLFDSLSLFSLLSSLCTSSTIDYSIPFFIPFPLYFITLADKTIDVEQHSWQHATFRRRYLKQDVYWYCNKTKAINPLISDLTSLHITPSSAFFSPTSPPPPPSPFPLTATSVYFFSLYPVILLIPLHRSHPICPSPPSYLDDLSMGQGTLRRLSYCPGCGKSIDFLMCSFFFSCHRMCLI